MHADNRMHPKFADMLWGTGVLYQIKLLGYIGLNTSGKFQDMGVGKNWMKKLRFFRSHMNFK